MKTGWDLDTVTDMDVLTFNSVCAVMTRIIYREKVETAWTSMVAAQGERASMESLTSSWLRAIGDNQAAAKQKETTTKKGEKGASAFRNALKIGPKGGSF